MLPTLTASTARRWPRPAPVGAVTGSAAPSSLPLQFTAARRSSVEAHEHGEGRSVAQSRGARARPREYRRRRSSSPAPRRFASLPKMAAKGAGAVSAAAAVGHALGLDGSADVRAPVATVEVGSKGTRPVGQPHCPPDHAFVSVCVSASAVCAYVSVCVCLSRSLCPCVCVRVCTCLRTSGGCCLRFSRCAGLSSSTLIRSTTSSMQTFKRSCSPMRA
jgi:hypothetical protein